MKQLSESKKEELLQNEGNILQKVLGAAQQIEQTERKMTIKRADEEFFSFRIRPLTQGKYEKVQELATRYTTNKLGAKVVESYSQENASARLILEATHPEDREKIWNNKDLWSQLNALTAHQVIPKVLLPGEISAIVENIDDLSGFTLNKDDMAVNKRDERDELKN